jgi:hypothetical protein
MESLRVGGEFDVNIGKFSSVSTTQVHMMRTMSCFHVSKIKLDICLQKLLENSECSSKLASSINNASVFPFILPPIAEGEFFPL